MFEVDNVAVYGAGWTRAPQTEGVDIVIDLSGYFNTWRFPRHWAANSMFTTIVGMDITDFSCPDVSEPFWGVLWGDLANEAARAKRLVNVLVGCLGGHGRTGTVLVCLAHAAGYLETLEVDPITWVRTAYCKHAIESIKQLDYIIDVLGYKVSDDVYNETFTVDDNWGVGGGSITSHMFKTISCTTNEHEKCLFVGCTCQCHTKYEVTTSKKSYYRSRGGGGRKASNKAKYMRRNKGLEFEEGEAGE